MQIKFAQINIQCSTGNIAAQNDIVAVVNPTGSQLGIGQGVSATLHSKAGSGLYEESVALGPLRPGQAVLTGGYRLPNRYVIHCCIPFQSRSQFAPKQLAECYRNVLLLAEKVQIESIAFPSLITGSVGAPPQEPAQIALDAIREMAPKVKGIRTIRFVLFNRNTYLKYRQLLEAQTEQVLDRGLA